jgi:predicted transcriptional regulator
MSRLLAAVTRAANRRTTADETYRAAIRAARDAGHTMTEIGQAAGITKQAVRVRLIRDAGKGKP